MCAVVLLLATRGTRICRDSDQASIYFRGETVSSIVSVSARKGVRVRGTVFLYISDYSGKQAI